MHRPFDLSGNMGRMDYDAAAPMYKKWMADLTAYLEKMELPAPYIATFIATVRSDNMYMLGNNELISINNQPSKSEWLTNRCGQWTTPENNELGDLEMAKFQGQYYDSARRNYLLNRLTSIQSCKSAAQFEQRKAAFARIFGH